ncbi:dihydroneopterin aldolase [Limisphaera ngatamarikiensis]|jgi:dihydroneopterin aldolase|uniref:dihydroneopterin aldolase n=1 Tax=Limisphaera ngatamarikiensis TaxID=1324935 RepID=A0A6M1RFB8_9BACT|nr:dihydroneopterin aldolase [Limisphaera ngatamarikiensis]NGO38306.1 dihydroneopterin aldolase [Limisphaera ngatamarikiensis]
MLSVSIVDLEVFYRVGVSEAERAHPQRLLVSLEMEPADLRATVTDDLAHTIDYHAVSRDLLGFGEGRSWALLEKLAADLAGHVLQRYRPAAVTVEIKKFVLPEARHVAVRLRRTLPEIGAPQPG